MTRTGQSPPADPAPGSSLRGLSSLVSLAGFLIGLLASAGVLGGDDFGRVNLLYALLLFALAPAFGLALTLALMISGRRRGIISFLVSLKLVPRQLREQLNALPTSAQRSAQLFFASQLTALAFTLGSLAGFALLLLATDISFVWRSTLLDAASLLPLLDLVATPWRFWPAAQPSLEMLKLTQDFRLASAPDDAVYVGQWWRYLLAAQLFYSLLPRALLALAARVRLARRPALQSPSNIEPNPDASAGTAELAPIVTTPPTGATLLDFAHLPPSLAATLAKKLGATEFVDAGSARRELLATDSQTSARLGSGPFIVLVRSWEPPLGELADTLDTLPVSSECFIAPLDWQDETLTAPLISHRSEWRRFCAAHARCRYLAISPLSEEDES